MKLELDAEEVDYTGPPEASLLEALRGELRCTSARQGCDDGSCGSCVVLLDGQAVAACTVPMAHVEGRRVQTAASLLASQEAFRFALIDAGAVQCGFCLPGIVVSVAAGDGLEGHLCRCSGYVALQQALEEATGG